MSLLCGLAFQDILTPIYFFYLTLFHINLSLVNIINMVGWSFSKSSLILVCWSQSVHSLVKHEIPKLIYKYEQA